MLLNVRQKYGHGLRVAYYRDRVRPRILETAPVACGVDSACEIHTLTSSGDWLNLVWALKSFYRYSGKRYGLCIHDDGSLDQEALAALAAHFPGARVVGRAEADRRAGEWLANYPRCLEFRHNNTLSLKVFDFARCLSAERLMLLDSDILFFAPPEELVRRIEDRSYRCNTANPDCATAYTVTVAQAQRLWDVPLVERFNSGLGVIQRDSLRLDWIEEFLTPELLSGHFWQIEQTLFALISSRYGVELLPDAYAVRLEEADETAPCRHYVGKIRHLMYREGMQRLARNGFLEA